MQIAARLLEWYDTHRRTLPWRAGPGDVPDPYHVWLSEVMLQQTTVATVRGYFDRFLSRWPTVNDLAAARQEDVLEEWAGLGYYARARNLHACANRITVDHGGKFPETASALRALPGIGDYASAAIAAIAFHEPATVIDGNVERIVSRLFCISEPMPKGRKAVRLALDPMVPAGRPGDFAQAMMDLGATVCRPTNPACRVCPLSADCKAFGAGRQSGFPVKGAKKAKPVRRIIAFALLHENDILLERRPDKGLLGGTLGLPSTPWEPRESFPETWQDHAPANAGWEEAGTPDRHTFTHFHLETRLLQARTDRRLNKEGMEWIRLDEHLQDRLPTVFAKMIRAVAQ